MKKSRRGFISTSSLFLLSGVIGKNFAHELLKKGVNLNTITTAKVSSELIDLCTQHETSLTKLGYTRFHSQSLFSKNDSSVLVPYFQQVGSKKLNGQYLLFTKVDNWSYCGQLNEFDLMGVKHLINNSNSSESYFPNGIEIREGKKYFNSEANSYQICTRLHKAGIGIEIEIKGRSTFLTV